MSGKDGRPIQDEGARRAKGALLETPAFAERMPGLAVALDRFVVEAPRQFEPLVGRPGDHGSVEPVQTTTLFRAIGDCAGLTAATYAIGESQAHLLVALDDRIDDLVVASVFGESLTAEEKDAEEPRERTAIETALVEEFASALGRALEFAFAPLAPLTIAFDGLTALKDAFALGKKDMPAAAARFSLPLSAGACECLLLLPQTFFLPLRKALEHEPEPEGSGADSGWSLSMETGVKRTMLPVVAVLEEASLTLADIANLRIGSILPLASEDFNAVRLECSGRAMFRCRLGQGDGRYRLEIEAPLAVESEAVA